VESEPSARIEELGQGAVTVPRPAATVILLRGGGASLEVLLVRRTPHARFMAGAWVFPGGAVDRGEGAGDAGLRAAALRELVEEAGIALGDPEQLVPFARWITPARVKTRYDTWFYLAPAPAGAQPQIDGAEVIDAGWYSPSDALAAARRGELSLVFATVKQLQQLSGFRCADDLIAYARGRQIRPIEPRVVGSGETMRILLPGEPGYDG
jgi:8-oxo-dGTP pyrophosphatase MutT (NUDIX family)